MSDAEKRTIAASSLRALRAARGSTRPDTAAPDTAEAPADAAAEHPAEAPADAAAEAPADVTAEADVEADVDADVAADVAADAAADVTADAAAEADVVEVEVPDTVEDPTVDLTKPAEASPPAELAATDEADEADADADDSPATDTDTADDTDTDTDTDDAVTADDAPPVLASRAPRRTRRGAPAPAAARARPSRFTVITAGIAAAAAVFAVASGVVWWSADRAEARSAATARDDVLVDARVGISTVNTSDYRKPAAALDNWLAVSTGSLKSQFTDSRASAEKLLAQAKVITSAVVLDAAVTKLDTRKGSATVIASVNVKRQPVTGAATTTRNRFRATLTKVRGEWQLADLTLVPVGLT